jgi:hypothetical protein
VCNPRNNRTEPLGRPAQTRDALLRDPRQQVRWSCPVYPPPMVDVLGRVRRRTDWNASVDVLRRTRRNAYAIRGAAPEVNHRTSCRGSRGSAPYHRLIKSSTLGPSSRTSFLVGKDLVVTSELKSERELYRRLNVRSVLGAGLLTEPEIVELPVNRAASRGLNAQVVE